LALTLIVFFLFNLNSVCNCPWLEGFPWHISLLVTNSHLGIQPATPCTSAKGYHEMSPRVGVILRAVMSLLLSTLFLWFSREILYTINYWLLMYVNCTSCTWCSKYICTKLSQFGEERHSEFVMLDKQWFSTGMLSRLSETTCVQTWQRLCSLILPVQFMITV
jgi:hypothetical protein